MQRAMASVSSAKALIEGELTGSQSGVDARLDAELGPELGAWPRAPDAAWAAHAEDARGGGTPANGLTTAAWGARLLQMMEEMAAREQQTRADLARLEQQHLDLVHRFAELQVAQSFAEHARREAQIAPSSPARAAAATATALAQVDKALGEHPAIRKLAADAEDHKYLLAEHTRTLSEYGRSIARLRRQRRGPASAGSDEALASSMPASAGMDEALASVAFHDVHSYVDERLLAEAAVVGSAASYADERLEPERDSDPCGDRPRDHSPGGTHMRDTSVTSRPDGSRDDSPRGRGRARGHAGVLPTSSNACGDSDSDPPKACADASLGSVSGERRPGSSRTPPADSVGVDLRTGPQGNDCNDGEGQARALLVSVHRRTLADHGDIRGGGGGGGGGGGDGGGKGARLRGVEQRRESEEKEKNREEGPEGALDLDACSEGDGRGVGYQTVCVCV